MHKRVQFEEYAGEGTHNEGRRWRMGEQAEAGRYGVQVEGEG